MKKFKHFSQIFFTHSTTFLLVFAFIFTAALGFIYREQYSRNVEIHRQLVSSAQSQLDSTLEEMDRIVNGLIFNSSFIDIMADSKNTSKIPRYDDEMSNYFLMLDAPDLSTYRIIAFNENVYYTLTKSDENPSYIRRAAANYPWSIPVKEAGGEKVILPVHPDIFSDQKTEVYSVSRSITDGTHDYGIIEVQNEYSDLEAICSLDNVSGQLCLFADDGTLIYPKTENNMEIDFADIWKTVSTQNDSKGSFLHDGSQLSYETSAYSGWTVVMTCPFSALVPFGLESLILTVLVLLFLIGMIFVKNTINVSMQSRANEERANYLALQSQMNPHTIYNTLSMIECVAYMNGDMEASELCIRFSRMLRYISDYTKDIYNFEDEVNHLKNYAFLTQKRYDGKLDVHIQAEPGLLHEQLPKFTLQPLVENSIKHGFAGNIPHFVVNVDIVGTPSHWTIRIQDNGCGFSEESLHQIKEELKQADQRLATQSNILNRQIGKLAFSNIYTRCRILYKDKFYFSYGNNPDTPGAYVQLEFKQQEGAKS